MSLPKSVRTTLKAMLWDEADTKGWNNLTAGGKAKLYEQWTRDPEIGGVLRNYMDVGQVRVYIKDTLLKDYGRMSLSNPAQPLQAVDLAENATFVDRYIKPHGRRLRDGRI